MHCRQADKNSMEASLREVLKICTVYVNLVNGHDMRKLDKGIIDFIDSVIVFILRHFVVHFSTYSLRINQQKNPGTV